MAKEKVKKGVPNKHLHARIAFLHQAAEHLARTAHVQDRGSSSTGNGNEAGTENSKATQATSTPPTQTSTAQGLTPASKPLSNHPPTGLPTLLSSHLKSIAQKAQIRLSPDLKHSICKTCSAPLLEGLTSIKSVENRSKCGRKAWANVVVVECNACGTCKRFPVGAKRQARKGLRGVGKVEEASDKDLTGGCGEDAKTDSIGSNVEQGKAEQTAATTA